MILVMNDNHSLSEYYYKKRWITSLFKDSVKKFPVTVLIGARQTGKSTFLQEEFRDWHYLTLDNIDTLEQAIRAPEILWRTMDRVIIDEVQRAPALLKAIKLKVDKARNVRFILSGSANLLLMRHVSETLAGRAVFLNMLPMAIGEIENISYPKNFFGLLDGKLPKKDHDLGTADAIGHIAKGFMPPLLYFKESKDYMQWWEGYVMTYLERDLRELSQIESLVDFRKLMKALALRSGNILNQTDIARDVGLSQSTVYRYVNLLETSFLLERLPAYAVNRTKRLIKTPKVFWIDPGLAAFLSGLYDRESIINSREVGSLFETLVFLHLMILSRLTTPRSNLYYWRTTTQKEVDFVYEYGRKLVAIETKFADRVSYSDITGLLLFLQEYPETLAGLILYNGAEIRYFHEKIVALPWWWLAR